MPFQVLVISSHIFSYTPSPNMPLFHFVIHFVGKDVKLFTDKDPKIWHDPENKMNIEYGLLELISISYNNYLHQKTIISIPDMWQMINEAKDGDCDWNKCITTNKLLKMYNKHKINNIPLKHQKIILFNTNTKKCMYCNIEIGQQSNQNEFNNKGQKQRGICKKCKIYGFCSRNHQKKFHKKDPFHYTLCKNGSITRTNKYMDYSQRIVKEMILFSLSQTQS